MPRIHNGYRTIERETVTADDLFDVATDLLERIDRVEWVMSCVAILLLHKLDIAPEPSDPRMYDETVAEVAEWLMHFEQSQKRIERDRRRMEFMESAE